MCLKILVEYKSYQFVFIKILQNQNENNPGIIDIECFYLKLNLKIFG